MTELSTAGERGRRRRRRPPWRRWLLAYAFVAPVIVLTAAFSLVPLVMLAYRSLYKGNVFDTDLQWAGLANYAGSFQSGGGHAIGVTVVYTVLFVAVCMASGLGMALLLDVRLPGLRRVRAAFIVPLVVPTVATALIWGSLFAPQFGLISRLLSAIHLPEVNWFSSPAPALATVLLFGCWQFFGEDVILYLAALKSLPRDILEAATVDGAGAWQRFRHMRWPLLRRATALILVVTTLTGLQTFTQIFVLTNGGPGNATETVLYYIYNQGFVQNNTGQADAMGVILFLLSLLVTVMQIAIVRSAVE
ncbi:MAG: carbohydrate ABC transporter permease [Candidatus Dormibacteraceae bacterium]